MASALVQLTTKALLKTERGKKGGGQCSSRSFPVPVLANSPQTLRTDNAVIAFFYFCSFVRSFVLVVVGWFSSGTSITTTCNTLQSKAISYLVSHFFTSSWWRDEEGGEGKVERRRCHERACQVKWDYNVPRSSILDGESEERRALHTTYMFVFIIYHKRFFQFGFLAEE